VQRWALFPTMIKSSSLIYRMQCCFFCPKQTVNIYLSYSSASSSSWIWSKKKCFHKKQTCSEAFVFKTRTRWSFTHSYLQTNQFCVVFSYIYTYFRYFNASLHHIFLKKFNCEARTCVINLWMKKWVKERFVISRLYYG
jgi:hypothetical protein